MRRRGGTVVVRCIEKGCREDAIYDWRTIKERAEISKRAVSYRCLKHSRPTEWLRVGNARTEKVLVARRLAGLPNHLFWVDGDATTGNGFAHGSGYRAFAEDVPDGTVLRVIATLELPQAVGAVARPDESTTEGPRATKTSVLSDPSLS